MSIGSKSIKDFMVLAEQTLKAGDPVNVCFSGAPGLGKSAIVEAWAKDNQYTYLDVRLAQMEAPDVRGIQREIKGTKKLEYLTPAMWPETGRVVINLDEINRAPRSNINAALSILQERRIGELSLSKEAIIVACINEGPEYDVNELDPAVRDRLMFVPVEYNHADFLEYATAKNFHPHILGFLRSNLWVYRTPAQLGDKKYLANRSWTRLNSAYKASPQELKTKVVSMELGTELSKTFFAFLEELKPLTIKDFIDNEKAAFKALASVGSRHDLVASLVIDMAAFNAAEHFPLYGRIMEQIPLDLAVQVFYDQLHKFDQRPLQEGESPINHLTKNYTDKLFSETDKEFRPRMRAAVKLSDEAAARGGS